MTNAEQREAARQLFNKWNGRGKEDEDDRSFWIDILQDVLGMDHVTDRIEFQKKVVGKDGNVKRIDAYIPETRVLIEQKSLQIGLDKPQSGHKGMTPYQQAKEYDDGLPVSEKSRWIVTSNFKEIWIYNMDTPRPEEDIVKIDLRDIQSQFHLLDFMIDKGIEKVNREVEVSLQAGEYVGLIYDSFLKQYNNPEAPETLKSLNKLCVRLVFCLYAEDSGIFKKNAFCKYLSEYDVKTARKALIELFKILDQDYDKRDPYLKDDNPILAEFPYVNGGLFEDENIEIPPFTEEIYDLIVNKASTDFDWSQISPTIFGAVFESTLNQETRRSGGMHYTSIENIHKVIDPLFMDSLYEEFEEIKSKNNAGGARTKALASFQDKLASLKFLDPACGSGNFLTETFLSLRLLENKVLSELNHDFDENQLSIMGINDARIKVSIGQFYGIEINDFAVTVAKTALWIAEAQILMRSTAVVGNNNPLEDFLPLTTNAFIHEGNALRMDWEEVVPKSELNYIMGNPPFVANTGRSSADAKIAHTVGVLGDEQKEDRFNLFGKDGGILDYVACWYKKSSEYITGTEIEVAFVSTDSICQGQQVAPLWSPLFNAGIVINFAYTSFKWNSEASNKATVYVVIIGFSKKTRNKKKIIYEGNEKIVKIINAYLIEADNAFVSKSKKPLCNVPEMTTGNRPADGGYLIIEEKDYENFIQKEPQAKKYIKRLIGSEEYINNKTRYCLWLVGATPAELKSMPLVMSRLDGCREARLNGAPDRQKLAATPHLFRETKNPEKFIVVPKVSSVNRRYIPIGFMDGNTISTDLNFIIPDADLTLFGLLTSNVHMAWMRTVCGYFGPSYRYSKDIVYNNFPWPTPTDEQKSAIEKTAQGILDARALYPDSSLADLYDELTMPPELRKAHQENDKAVMKAYGFNIKEMSEADCVAELMRMYQELVKA